MRWYYAFNGQKSGPVGEAEFAQLQADGVIGPDTLVWKQGMASWQPFRELSPTAAFDGVPPLPPSPTEIEAPAWAKAAIEPSDRPPLKYAGFGLRVAASSIDFLLMTAVFAIMVFSGLDMAALKEAVDQHKHDEVSALMMQAMNKNAVTFHLIQLAYLLVFQKVFGATLGKLALGLRLVRADGQPVGWGAMTVRYAVGFICTNFTLGVAYLIAAFDEEKRALHDYASRTRVITKR